MEPRLLETNSGSGSDDESIPDDNEEYKTAL